MPGDEIAAGAGDGSRLVASQADREQVLDAERTGRAMVATVDLTDDRGGPRCARLDPLVLRWALAPA